MKNQILFYTFILFILWGNYNYGLTVTDDETMFAFPGWNRKQAITIQANQVTGSSNLVDFPVLITLDHLNSEIVDGGANSALNGGGDIRFSSDTNGNNQLAIEVVEFVADPTQGNRRCQIWVKVPTLSVSTDTTIYIWYDKSGEVQPPVDAPFGAQAVWSANYVSVWHLEEDPSTTAPQIIDSSGASNHGTTVVTMDSNDSQEGKVGNGIVFNGVDQLINVGNDSSLNLTSNFTISGWFNPTQFHNFYVMAKRSETVNSGYNMLPQSEQDFEYYDGSTIQDTGINYNINQWNYGVIKMNSNGNGIVGFLNGIFSSEVTVATLPDGLAQNLYLGGRSGNTLEMDGQLDELRVSNIYRSNDWIATEYNNQFNPGAFAVAGTPENGTSGGGGDTQAPSVPASFQNSAHSQTTANLSWNSSTDNVGVTGYRIYKDGLLEASLGNVTSHQVTGLTAGTSYNFTVSALDAAGNESPQSTAVSVTTDSSSGGGGGSSVWSESGSTASYSGEVGIGTSSVPSGYKLAVDGNIRTREIRVDQDTWPDYVFEEGYDLLTLEEIQKHINEKGHLPNIPSAQEVEANGMAVGEMNKLLLEKIEELTLYIIELKMENERQNLLIEKSSCLK